MLKGESIEKLLLSYNNPEKWLRWMHCPRCIKGNMYLDPDGEYVCIQCGHTQMPHTLKNTEST